jgi:hypothetical protein
MEPLPIKLKCLISKIGSTNPDSYIDYEYDTLDRVTKYGSFKMTYSPIGVLLTYGNLSELINLDVNGNAVSRSSLKQYSTSEEFVTISKNTTYTYNSEGYLLKELYMEIIDIQSSKPSVDTIVKLHNYEYENGNLKADVFYNNGAKSKCYYKYFENMPNQLAEFEQRLYFKGKKSKNLIKTVEETDVNSKLSISNYSYEIDSEGRLIKETITNQQGKSIRNFEWICK